MMCSKCKKTLKECLCEDCDDRLKKIAFDPDNNFIAFQWCRNCDKHHARCKCKRPIFFFVKGGKEFNHWK